MNNMDFDVWEEVRISMHQPCAFPETDAGKFIQASIERLKAAGFIPRENIHYLMSLAYGYGVINGKRFERARRKRGKEA